MKEITPELWRGLQTVDDGKLAAAISLILGGEANIIHKTIDEIAELLDKEIPGHHIGTAFVLQCIELDFVEAT